MIKWRIRTLLAVSMGGLVLVATVAVLAIALTASATNTFEMLSDRAVLLVDSIESRVRNRLDSASEVVDGIVGEVRAGHLGYADANGILNAFEAVLASAPEVEVLVYWDHQMVRRGVVRQPDGTLIRLDPKLETNARVRNELAALPPGIRRGWSEPVVENGVTYVSVAARTNSSSSDIAFVVAAVSVERFSAFIANVGRNYDATAFLLYGEDRLLAHPSLVTGKGPPHRGRAMISIEESTDPVIANLHNGHLVPFSQSAQKRGVDIVTIDAAGKRYTAMYRWIGGYGPEPIAVGAYFARSDITAELERLAISGVAGVVVAVIAVILAVVIGGLIARPIRRLALSASAVANLDFDHTERPAPSRIAELDEQVRAFNMMLDTLKVFETYVPRLLVRRLIARGGGRPFPSETREVTVMFTDIESFTAIAERMGAEETATFLNRHFGLLADCIRAENGTIDKYIGDAVMAFWGAPDAMTDHAAHAVRAARAIADTIAADNQRRAHKGLKPVRMRIGLHSGTVVVGNIGAPQRVNYTIVGDTVNVAQRLETLGHQLDGGTDVTVLMSAETARRAGLGPDEAEDVGAHRLAGAPQEIEVRRLIVR